jgi:hypothetical protein
MMVPARMHLDKSDRKRGDAPLTNLYTTSLNKMVTLRAELRLDPELAAAAR